MEFEITLPPMTTDVRFNAVARWQSGYRRRVGRTLRAAARVESAQFLSDSLQGPPRARNGLPAPNPPTDPRAARTKAYRRALVVELWRYTDAPRKLDADAAGWAAKPILDGIVDAGVLPDDGPDYIAATILLAPTVFPLDDYVPTRSWVLHARLVPWVDGD